MNRDDVIIEQVTPLKAMAGECANTPDHLTGNQHYLEAANA